jgi:hypothetical protein
MANARLEDGEPRESLCDAQIPPKALKILLKATPTVSEYALTRLRNVI